jgi:hypothetical protein
MNKKKVVKKKSYEMPKNENLKSKKCQKKISNFISPSIFIIGHSFVISF